MATENEIDRKDGYAKNAPHPATPKHTGRRRATWLQALVTRRGFNRTIVALANKTARIAWALLDRNEAYTAR